MSNSIYTVTIVVGPDTLWEAEAIRPVLEAFNIRVIKYIIGRPLDFINFLNGNDYLLKSDFIILSFHGLEGRFVMPILDNSIYELNEPKKNFGPNDILKYFKLQDSFIINTGCTLGNEYMANSFLNNGCHTYIGAVDYVEGNSSLFFVIRFFYEICTNHKSPEAAFNLASSTDTEVELFRLYKK